MSKTLRNGYFNDIIIYLLLDSFNASSFFRRVANLNWNVQKKAPLSGATKTTAM